MLSTGRIAATILIFIASSIAWMSFGGMMTKRLHDQGSRLDGQVQELWGQQHHQVAPRLTYHWWTQEAEVQTEYEGGGGSGGRTRDVKVMVPREHEMDIMPVSSDINVGLHLDERLKGVLWYALYDVAFDGHWTFQNTANETREFTISFAFPDGRGVYDGFAFTVDGQDRSNILERLAGDVRTTVSLRKGQSVDVRIAYKSRGKDAWTFIPSTEVSTLERFQLHMTTDFKDIDFPAGSLSPSTRTETEGGWSLAWDFSRAVSGRSIGMVMPQHIQPGELAATLAFSAPVSLLFFLVVMLVLCVLRGIDLHPINILFLAAGFFAFHLLFGYSVDHLSIIPAFILSSVVSMVLVVSYMRLVVSPGFAGVQVAGAQLVYLVGFSLAHFFDGFTGLTVTVLAILTLFAIMQLTGRIRWSEVGKTPEALPSTETAMPRASANSPVTSAAPAMVR